jgi:hypothetical protein
MAEEAIKVGGFLAIRRDLLKYLYSERGQANWKSILNNLKEIGIDGSRTSKIGVSLDSCGGATGSLLIFSRSRERPRM